MNFQSSYVSSPSMYRSSMTVSAAMAAFRSSSIFFEWRDMAKANAEIGTRESYIPFGVRDTAFHASSVSGVNEDGEQGADDRPSISFLLLFIGLIFCGRHSPSCSSKNATEGAVGRVARIRRDLANLGCGNPFGIIAPAISAHIHPIAFCHALTLFKLSPFYPLPVWRLRCFRCLRRGASVQKLFGLVVVTHCGVGWSFGRG